MRKLIISLILICSIFLFFSGCSNKEIVIEYTKIVDEADVPVKIMENIRELDLQRGAWAFHIGDWYETEKFYVMFCGGEADGYDVQMNGIAYSESSSQGGIIMDVYLTPFIEESSTTKTQYSEGLTYPIVVYRVDTMFGIDDELSRVYIGEFEPDTLKIDLDLVEQLEILPNYPSDQ